jgi:hypothetical protein
MAASNRTNTSRTVVCRFHCSPCGRHFGSLEAFDLHHEHDKTGWPICLSAIDLEDRDGKVRLLEMTKHGECRAYAEVEQGVTVWTDTRHVGMAKKYFGSRARSEPAVGAQRPSETVSR